eukprot:SAG31_NODE_11673_length_1007_cov_7.606828_1_plen_194_part_00
MGVGRRSWRTTTRPGGFARRFCARAARLPPAARTWTAARAGTGRGRGGKSSREGLEGDGAEGSARPSARHGAQTQAMVVVPPVAAARGHLCGGRLRSQVGAGQSREPAEGGRRSPGGQSLPRAARPAKAAFAAARAWAGPSWRGAAVDVGFRFAPQLLLVCPAVGPRPRALAGSSPAGCRPGAIRAMQPLALL